MLTFVHSKASRRVLLASGALVIASATAWGSAAIAASGAPQRALLVKVHSRRTPRVNVHSARLPLPVPVTVNPSTTAYLVLDLTSAICAPNPSCVATLPAAAALLAKARAAGSLVVYSETPTPGSKILPQVQPVGNDEPIVYGHADKFYNTTLNTILSSAGITTLVVVGTAANGAVLYTTFEANLRGYTAVVAEDGVSANSPFIMRYSLFQLLNQPGFSNPLNTPPPVKGVTLSTSNLITFSPAG